MLKNVVSILIFIFAISINKCEARHITGGEMIYDYIGLGNTLGNKVYRITLRLFRDENCFSCAPMPDNVTIAIYNNQTLSPEIANQNINRSSLEQVSLNALPSCITNEPNLVYSIATYTFTVILPDNNSGFTAVYQTCCRIDGIANVPDNVGATYTATIPGINALGSASAFDNSPRFFTGISVICYRKPFTLNFSATDPDGDSLVYRLCPAYDGGAATNSTYDNPSAPPYASIGYKGGYSGISPMGSAATINRNTGIISGIAPDAGKYVVSVCVESYNRTTRQIRSVHRKDFIVTVAPCDFAGAELQPNYISCDGFTFNFENLNTSPLNNTFYWDFGDGNTSTIQNPVHTYTTAGIYTLKLVVNRGAQCADSTTSQLNVFPGFFPAFNDNSPMCKELPVQFNDATTANYGTVNSWEWNFGMPGTPLNISKARNPVFTYTASGNYQVQLIVGSDRGCLDTIVKTINIVDKPDFAVPNDTLICSIDTIRLNTVSNITGNIVWSPNYMIDDENSFAPLVSPDVTTTYTAQYVDPFGCTATEMVTVKVVDFVTLQAAPDTTICLTDTMRLRLVSDALNYSWTPAATLNNATIQNPIATPVNSSTTYNVRASIGKCFAQEQIVVRTVPYPNANAGLDTTICFGTSTQLQASGGSIYTWNPGRFLNNPNIANPVVQAPPLSTRYIVEVRDVLGCPKPVYDTLLVNVAKIIANAGPRDTSVVLGQPLQLTATGSTNYLWSPVTWLNNPTIFNPLSLPQDNIDYIVRVSNPQGCFSLDTISVKVFKIDPDLLVPTAFSPDADGLNDIFRPIAIGMKSLDAFRVYNRWGQLIYSTTRIGTGWDGTFGGQPQSAGTYVWIAEGTNYLDKKIEKKGSVVLIR